MFITFCSCSVRVSLAALLLAGTSVAAAPTAVAERCEISGDIQLMPEIRPVVDRMLASSSTFRAQYCRVADAPSLVVGVGVDPALSLDRLRSQTTIRRYHSGLIVAIVALAPGRHWEEWIAHEFEHILEQMEGLDLPQAAARGADVWYTGASRFETVRAIMAGRAVFDEVRHDSIAVAGPSSSE
jgi:hypothetical protein